MSRSKAYHHGDLPETLLRTTVELLEESGPAALSLREVSRRAGVSHAAAYNHFAGKATLLGAVVDRAFAEFARVLHRARTRGVDPVDALRRMGVAYVRFACEHRAEFKLMFRPELASAPDEGGDDAYAELAGAVRDALDARAIAGDPEMLALAAWSTVHGFASLVVDGPLGAVATSTRELERRADAVVRILQAGMLTSPKAPAR